MVKQTVMAEEDQPFSLVHSSPGRLQTRIVIAVALVLGALSISMVQLSHIQLGRIDAFVPAYGTAIFVNDLITAVLLFNQFAILRSRALLAISCGYLFTALMVLPWLLTFPGVFTPAGLLGAGLQTTNWLAALRYAGFSTFVIVYALSKDAERPKRWWEGSATATILSSAAISAAIVCALTLLVTAGNAYLPRISIDRVHFSTLLLYVIGLLILLNTIALALLWIRRRSVLDLWLTAVVWTYEIEIYLVSIPGLARFSVGWYAGRLFGLVSSILLLFVLLHEITMLYAQLLSAVLAQRREREARLMTGDTVSGSIAHEVKQPLTAIIASANAGLNWLERSKPNLDSVGESLRRVVAAGHLADAAIDNIRAQFKINAWARTSLDIDHIIQEALAVVRDRLQTCRITVQAAPGEGLPPITGEQSQLQQVLVNLITNAIDSMAVNSGERVLSIRSEIQHPGYVMVSIEDTGLGIEPGVMDRVFNPMFTTKTHGMGMGLSICRSIIEAHQGQLWVTAAERRGAIFHFTVPIDQGGVS